MQSECYSNHAATANLLQGVGSLIWSIHHAPCVGKQNSLTATTKYVCMVLCIHVVWCMCLWRALVFFDAFQIHLSWQYLSIFFIICRSMAGYQIHSDTFCIASALWMRFVIFRPWKWLLEDLSLSLSLSCFRGMTFGFRIVLVAVLYTALLECTCLERKLPLGYWHKFILFCHISGCLC